MSRWTLRTLKSLPAGARSACVRRPRRRSSRVPGAAVVAAAVVAAALGVLGAPVARANSTALLGATDPRPGATATLSGVECTPDQAQQGVVWAWLYASSLEEVPDPSAAIGIDLVYTGLGDDGLPAYEFVIPAVPAGAYLGAYRCSDAEADWGLAVAEDGEGLEIVDGPWASTHCSLGACGRATLQPSEAPVGARVVVTADWGYFGLWGPDWMADAYVLLVARSGDLLPGDGTPAKLTVVGDRRATFRVPEIEPGAWGVLFSGEGGDTAFGQPLVHEPFVVTRGRVPDTDAAPGSRPAGGSSGWVAAGMGIVALALALRRGRRDRSPAA